ncbi:hillarin-like [Liolophura sinensis]|uniref:hillarin-like n=1 Tax=Liolophura sinensis TaxID=3198878 RepID=UPI0031583F49
MLDKITDTYEHSKTKNFCRSASLRMKRKMKDMSRALTFKKRSWDLSQNSHTSKDNSTGDVRKNKSCMGEGQSDVTLTLLASFDEVYQRVMETSRDLSCAIDKLDENSRLLAPLISTPEETTAHTKPKTDQETPLDKEKSVKKDHSASEAVAYLDDIFTQLDQHALRQSSRDYTNLNDVVQDLTAICQNEKDLARVLFRWVVAVSGNITSSDLLQVYRTGHDSYHRLYRELCRIAGLSCRIIVGWSKGVGYKPNMALTDIFRNCWTAVSIDGAWRFVNCVWAARHVTSDDENDVTVERYDDFYFLTEAEDHISQHYPDDPEWQLLDTPLSMDDFLHLPVLKSAFFHHDLSFPTPVFSRMTTDTGVIDIRLNTPEIFAFGSVLETCEAGPMNRIENCVLQTVVDSNTVVFRVSLPYPGRYYFSVYVGDYWQPQSLETACSVQLDFTGAGHPTNPFPVPHPPVPFYGPTPVSGTLGVSCSTSDPLIVVADDSDLELTFNIPDDVSVTQTFQYHHSQSGALIDMDRLALATSRTNQRLRYSFRCSNQGYYVFSMYGTKDVTVPLDCVYRCLIFAQHDSPRACPFPVLHSKWTDCTLHSPLNGELTPNSVQTFKLDVPKAERLSVSVSGKTFSLGRASDGSWEGDIFIGESGSVVKVMGEFRDSNGVSTSCLLNYILEPRETTV